ncbi:MAG: ATP-binding cassette domain-containing protein [Peptostreptococcus sp.]|uniref:ABC transporter ATP-binding protein n=1 Tax=Peptostreptococcus sp. TaxID=1262 RepID=UPI002FC5FA38
MFILIEIKNICHKFGELSIIDNINFFIKDQEIVAILGPSGCGKSTLLRILSGLEDSTSGTITGIKGKIAFTFQDDRLLAWRNVWDNIKVVKDKENKEKIRTLIKDVGLEGFESYKPAQLSGGMKKRLGVARTFYYEGDLILMDEPFSGLDYYMRQDMLEMLLRVWNKNRQSILFVTHEIDEALKIADRILILSKRPTSIKKEFQLPDRSLRHEKRELINNIREEILALTMD